MEDSEAHWIMNAVILASLSSILLVYGNQRWASPVIAILNRWLRWIVFAAGIAVVSRELGWSDRPFWVLAVSAFLVWFLGETMFNWIAIKALSQSPIPLFPRFVENSEPEEWPVQKRFLRIRDWLRTQNFRQIQSLKTDLGMGIFIRSFVFQSEDNRTRIQAVFVPQRTGSMTACFSLHSISEDGIRYVTDNLYLPFGGFYPENWRIVRKPLTRGIHRLNLYHQRRLERSGKAFEKWEETPVDDLNDQQMLMEKLNTELGFLYPRHLREEYGKITMEGRYRVWKEVWLLNYFGKSIVG